MYGGWIDSAPGGTSGASRPGSSASPTADVASRPTTENPAWHGTVGGTDSVLAPT